MSSETESHRRIPTLVQLCQRVASAHVEAITGFGDDLRYDLIEPILESCTAENLARIEKASPHIRKGTPEIWKNMCFRNYPLAGERYQLREIPEHKSWRDLYYVLREAEAKRLEEIGSRIRSQRLEAEEKKKEREVKLVSDRILPPKRSRTGWATTTQPKTLFQKTRSEASKLQKTIYSARIVPPMPRGKGYRTLPSTTAQSSSVPPIPSSGTRVTVKRVSYRRSSPPSESAPTSLLSRPPLSSSVTPPKPLARPGPLPTPTKRDGPPPPPMPSRKDPMATLFMPKHRTHSQLPRAVPSK